jgi:isopentenyldiphosphate isomerase
VQFSEPAIEYFQTYSDAGAPLGLMPRDQVHAQGLWHCSAYVLLFNDADELLLQLRAEDKDLYPSYWDYSVGEHLKPGETYEQGAMRGLLEELGIEVDVLVSLGDIEKASWSGPGFKDCSIFRGFAARSNNPIRSESEEISQVRWIASPELGKLLKGEVDVFTPWSLPHLANSQRALAALSKFTTG